MFKKIASWFKTLFTKEVAREVKKTVVQLVYAVVRVAR